MSAENLVHVSKPMVYTSDQIALAMRARYQQPEWALFFEVADATGARQRRWADAVAINCFPSRGLEIHGFEFKVYRGDWTRELRDPHKSEPVQRYCDRWWIVAPKNVAKAEELPKTWGLLTFEDGKLRQTVPAPLLTAQPVTRDFMTAVLRSAGKASDGQIAAMIEKRTEDIQKQADEAVRRELERRRDAGATIVERAKKLEELTGIDLLRGYTPTDDVAAAIKFAMSTDLTDKYSGVNALRQDMKRFISRLDEALQKIGYPVEQDV